MTRTKRSRKYKHLVKQVFFSYKVIWDMRSIPDNVDARTHADEFVDEMNNVYLNHWLTREDLRLSSIATLSYKTMSTPGFPYWFTRMTYSLRAISERNKYATYARTLDLVEEDLKELFRQEILRERRGQRRRGSKRVGNTKNVV